MSTSHAHLTNLHGRGQVDAISGVARGRQRRRWAGWTISLLLAVIAVVAVLVGGRCNAPAPTGGAAPGFRLASTSGGTDALADHRGENLLLYFNEGVGCDVCFLQTAKLEADGSLGRAGVSLLPIVMNSMSEVRSELDRFGVRTPYLTDPGGTTPRAYGTLGTGHHSDLPGHSFILVGPDGRIRWRGDYPGMWVDPGELAAVVSANLG